MCARTLPGQHKDLSHTFSTWQEDKCDAHSKAKYCRSGKPTAVGLWACRGLLLPSIRAPGSGKGVPPAHALSCPSVVAVEEGESCWHPSLPHTVPCSFPPTCLELSLLAFPQARGGAKG